ncbi:hypothetical protein JVU11DRAFT_5764 [Chiua virens]|nr:hypothetical protein JVU11DRAFT_5764 [Chiua virens]
MSFATLRQLSNCFIKFLASLEGSLPYRLINRLFAFLSSLRRWKRPSKPTLHQRHGSTTSLATRDGRVVYPMNVPSPASGPSDVLGRGWQSHTDLPYRSPSGGHLSPFAPARRYSRDAPWIPDETSASIPDELDPNSRNASSAAADSISRTNSNTNVFGLQGSLTSSSDIHTHSSLPPSPHHGAIAFTAEPSPLASRPSSQQSIVSRTSHRSGCSTGRASYRKHHVPIPTSVQDVSILASSSSTTLRRGELRLSAVIPFQNTIAAPNAIADDASQGGCRFLPMPVSDALRYEHRKTRSPTEHNHEVEAMFFDYPDTPVVPEGWSACRHPEGALYFVHDESKTFTEVNICNAEIQEDVEYFRTFLFSELQAEIRKLNLSELLNIDEVQLVLEPRSNGIVVDCHYYFANPRTRSLFWLNGWEATDIFKGRRGNLSIPHKGLAIREQYWRHWNLYPNFCEITEELKDEVENMILHAICDHLTSRKSTSPLNTEELKSHLYLIKEINLEKKNKHGHFAIIIGRIMREFYHTYFLHFHGEDCARLDLDQTIYGWQYHPSLLMSTVTPLLFMTPMHNVRQLHKIYVDDIVNGETWNKFVDKLNTELKETSVLATVLLNANVSFLQVLGEVPSPQQYLTYLSLVASVASIILGLVFMGHSRTGARTTPKEAADFLSGLWHNKHGLENLAIIYSLPHSFLMWGMILFFAAFSVQWFYPGNMTWRSGAGAFMLVVILLITLCIWTTRDRCHYWWFQPDPKTKVIEAEGEGADQVPSFRIAGVSYLLHWLTTLFSRLSNEPQESYPMHENVIRVPGVYV